tara:strand:- start:199 stop:1134 length:936 start_codon:yes stop_codon:yes gene_type:complete
MFKIYPENIKELKKEKYDYPSSNKKSFKNNETFIIFDDSNMINLSNIISNNISQNTKYFKILDKKPFYILKIENEVYLIKKDKIKEVKKYIYKNKINKKIYLSDVIDPNMDKRQYNMLQEGLKIEQLELINVKDIKSLEEFKISTLNYKKEINKENKNNNKIIYLRNEKSFLNIKEDLEFSIKNLDYLDLNYNIDELLKSLFTIEKRENKNYLNKEYSKINIIGNYIKIENHKEEKYININHISKIKLINEEEELKFQDPLGKEFFYKFYIVVIYIYINTNQEPEKFYCFEEDLKKNELFKVNKNNFLKEI